jgi:hypothetical protein
MPERNRTEGTPMTDTAAAERQIVIRVQPAVVIAALLAILLSLAAAFRWFGTGRDYGGYLNYYNQIGATGMPRGSRMEPGFAYGAWFFKNCLGAGFPVYYALLVGLSLALKFRLLLKYATAPLFAIGVYILLLYPLHEYTQLRIAFGIAMIFTAIDLYFDNHRFAAALSCLTAILFHSSTLIFLVVAIGVRFVVNRRPVFVMALIAAAGTAISLAVAKIGGLLQAQSLMLEKYVKQSHIWQTPTAFSGQNVLLFAAVVSSAVFLRPWQNFRDRCFFLLSLFYYMFYFSLSSIPVFARRLSDMFIIAFLFYTFRFDNYSRSRIPALFMLLAGFWVLYKNFQQGLISIF